MSLPIAPLTASFATSSGMGERPRGGASADAGTHAAGTGQEPVSAATTKEVVGQPPVHAVPPSGPYEGLLAIQEAASGSGLDRPALRL